MEGEEEVTPKSLPSTDREWLTEIAAAYRDAASAKWFGVLTKGSPIRESEYCHLAPHVCLKFRGIKASKVKRFRIVEGVLASMEATISNGDGGEYIQKSPVMAFAFCYLAAHFVLDLLDEQSVATTMDMCVTHEDELTNLLKSEVPPPARR